MELIKLTVKGISYSQTQSGAYALILVDEISGRTLPVVIGSFEAQAIAVAIENDVKPARPLTHDLFYNFALQVGARIQRVLIYKMVDGVFYANIVWTDASGREIITDSRTSDAIALSIRFRAPVYTYPIILDKGGIVLKTGAGEPGRDFPASPVGQQEHFSSPFQRLSPAELSLELEKAVETEDYERAAEIRDEIEKRKQK